MAARQHARAIGAGVLSVAIRFATMGISFAAITASYVVLSARDFTIFNLAQFCIALGSAIASPINRAFWAGDSAKVFASGALSTMVLVSATAMLGLLGAHVGSWAAVGGGLILGGVASLYGSARVIERFSYGRILIERDFARALLISLLFALADGGTVALMWLFSWRSLPLRLLLPPLFFLAAVIATPYRRQLAELARGLRDFPRHLAFMYEQMISWTGARVLALTAIATFAGMADRLILVHFPLASEQLTADYLLALSYAIAAQTLMTLIFDLARKHVFYDGEWRPEARRFTIVALISLVGIVGGAIAAYPVFTFVGVLPRSIGAVLWAALLVRALSLLLCYIFNIDHFQTGSVEVMFLPNLAIMAASGVMLTLLITGASQSSAALILLAGCAMTCIALANRFFRRMPT